MRSTLDVLVGCVGVLMVGCGQAASYRCESDDLSCFNPPSARVSRLVAGGAEPANYSCDAPAIAVSNAPIDLAGVVTHSFGGSVAQAVVEVFSDHMLMTPIGSATTDASGAYALTLAAGTPNRISLRVTHWSVYTMLWLEAPLDLTMPSQTMDLVAAGIGAFDPVVPDTPPTWTLSIVYGRVVDCDGSPVEHAVVAVTRASGRQDVLPGTDDFVDDTEVQYFSVSDPDLPVRRTVRADTNTNGLFMAHGVPPVGAGEVYFVQAWGYLTTTDLQQGAPGLALLSEFELPALDEQVVYITLYPTEGLTGDPE